MTVIERERVVPRLTRKDLDRVATADGPLPDASTITSWTFDGAPCHADRMLWADKRKGEDWDEFQSRLDRAARTCLSGCARVRECRALGKSLGWPEGVWGGLVAGHSREPEAEPDWAGAAVSLDDLADSTGVRWCRVPESDFAVSEDGRVVKVTTGRMMKPYERYGKLSIRISGKRRSIHNLVLYAFGPPRPEGYVAGWVNGDSTDNRIGNLQWVRRWKPARPECRRGHKMDDDNTYVTPAGYRKCRACMKNSRERARSEGVEVPTCTRGHVLDDETAYTDPIGRRKCRECRVENDRKRAGR